MNTPHQDTNGSWDNEEPTQQPVAPAKPAGPQSKLNRNAVKRHALLVSKKTRNGKFTRVSSAFIDEISEKLETKLRQLQAPVTNSVFDQVEPEEVMLTGEGKRRVAEAFNVWLAREIHRSANNVRVGITL
jgi:hypothetical protein